MTEIKKGNLWTDSNYSKERIKIISQLFRRNINYNFERVTDCIPKWLSRPRKEDSHEKDSNTNTH